MNTYQSYKNSYEERIGLVPEHFELSKLKYLCSVSTGNKDTKDRFDDGEYPFYVRSPVIEKINSYSFDGEAVLTVGDGAGTGKVFHYVNGKFDFHQRVYKFSNFKKIIGKFFFIYMKNQFIFITEDQNNKSTVDSLRRPLIDSFNFVVPPISEQEKIVDYLDHEIPKIDNLIGHCEKKIKLLKEQKKALITSSVSKGLNPNSRLIDSRIKWIGEVPSHWKLVRLKYLFSLKGGKDPKNIEIKDGQFPILGTGGEISRGSDFLYDKPTVLLGRKGTIDQPFLYERPFWVSDVMYYTIQLQDVSAHYLNFLFSLIPFKYYQYGSTTPSMSRLDYESMVFPIPPIHERMEIEEYLNNEIKIIDESIFKEEKRVELLKEYSQSFIFNIITGKFDIRNEVCI
jgi:type I restriction enzyme, S subunit